MAIAFRSSADDKAVAASITVTKPSGVASGDVLVATVTVMEDGAIITITTPAGWTLVLSETQGTDLRMSVYYKVAGGSEPADYSWTLSGTCAVAAGISAYTGVNNSWPVDVSGGDGGNSSAPTAPSVTTTLPNDWLVFSTGVAQFVAVTPPSGFTERFEDRVSDESSRWVTVESADDEQVAPGASGAKAASLSGAQDWCASLVALRANNIEIPLALDDGAEGGDGAPSWAMGMAEADGADAGDALAWAMGMARADGAQAADAAVLTPGKVLGDGAAGAFAAPTWAMGMARADEARAFEVIQLSADAQLVLGDVAWGGDALAWALAMAAFGDGAQAVDAAITWAMDMARADAVLPGEGITGKLVGMAEADGAQVGDAAPAWAMGMARTAGVTAADALSWILAQLLADGADIGESVGWAMTLAAFADGATVGDSADVVPGKVLGDGVTAADAATWLLGKAAADGALAGFGALVWGLGQLLEDGATAGEALGWILAQLLGDGAQVGDVAGLALVLAAFGDGAQVGESAGLTPGKVFGDGATVGDAATWSQGVSLADGVTAGDVAAWAMGMARADGATAGDVAQVLLILTLALADGAAAADVFDLAKGLLLADGAAAADVVAFGLRLPGLSRTLWADTDGRATHQVVWLVEDDTLPILAFKLLGPDDERLVLEGATVRFQMIDRSGAVVVDGACVVVARGMVTYTLAVGDTGTVGEFWAQVVTVMGGETMVSERVVVRVRARL